MAKPQRGAPGQPVRIQRRNQQNPHNSKARGAEKQWVNDRERSGRTNAAIGEWVRQVFGRW